MIVELSTDTSFLGFDLGLDVFWEGGFNKRGQLEDVTGGSHSEVVDLCDYDSNDIQISSENVVVKMLLYVAQSPNIDCAFRSYSPVPIKFHHLQNR